MSRQLDILNKNCENNKYEDIKLKKENLTNNLCNGSNNTNIKENDNKEENLSTKSVSKTRCNECNKKLGLIPFNCKCQGFFCTIHRYPEKHNCDFDHVTFQREKLIKDNPVIRADKLSKI